MWIGNPMTTDQPDIQPDIQPDVGHLLGRPAPACPSCGHFMALHWHQPACLVGCGCTLDPICPDCGELTSKHEEAP